MKMSSLAAQEAWHVRKVSSELRHFRYGQLVAFAGSSQTVFSETVVAFTKKQLETQFWSALFRKESGGHKESQSFVW